MKGILKGKNEEIKMKMERGGGVFRMNFSSTTKKTGLGKLLGDVKSLVQNVGTKLKEGRAAAISKEKDRKEVDSKRTFVERMNRKGKSQYQLDQMDAAQARKQAKKAATEVKPPEVIPVVENGDGATGDGTGAVTVVETPKVEKGLYHTFTGKKGDKYKYRGKFHVNANPTPGDYYDNNNPENAYEFQRPGSDVWEVATGKGKAAIRDLYLSDDTKADEITPFYKKSPLEKGIGKYAKKAKGSRGYKMNK
jgi:hypothetical protein